MNREGATTERPTKRLSESDCACGHQEHLLQPSINRRRFIAIGSGCVVGMCAGHSHAASGMPPVDIGPIKKFDKDGIFDEFTGKDFFVIRREGKLYAASTECPHMYNSLQRDPQDATRITCSTHGAAFDAEGLVLVGPATTGLIRLGIELNDKGHVIVNPSLEHPQDKWTDKGCFLEVK